eukprot:CAMPEP_0181430680 /NCGR_PEP_ID=MMETSP1110-20121109/17847_1 /TAXON_ID=174948 /ORGANISM="Symbiodinium sp., Strain CCMP421" /LENGTH=105 /DNA_ID=CAMNT_0023554001 /DNA_START=137 /DNA_END=454 /DNA_ORIENTATION=+
MSLLVLEVAVQPQDLVPPAAQEVSATFLPAQVGARSIALRETLEGSGAEVHLCGILAQAFYRPPFGPCLRLSLAKLSGGVDLLATFTAELRKAQGLTAAIRTVVQ